MEQNTTVEATAGVRSSPKGARSSQWRYGFDVITHLVGREFKLRYRRAVLGWVWALAVPLVRLVILSFVFTQVLPLGIANYPAFLFTGLIGWTWFGAAVASATSSALDHRELLFRPGVPRAVIPIVSVLTAGLDYLAALPVLAVFLVFTSGIHLTALALPAVVALQILLMLGIGFVTCSLNVHLRDTRLLVDLGLLLGFYVTPVFYSGDKLPERFHWVAQLNPVARLMNAYRDILLEGQLPRPVPFLFLAVASALLCAAGYAVYRAVSPTFVDEL